MKVKLVKRNQQSASSQETAKPASQTNILTKAQSWVEEFKARKATDQTALLQLIRQT
ncbi:MAG TPA: hypothetical protein VNO70_06645 [Blastocatellia bacterium]|nr:hypothetical protein [Blastocatellia bacterium]